MVRSSLSAGRGRGVRRGAMGLVAAVLLILATPVALAEGLVADRFASNGDQISGWYWLRDSTGRQYAEYTWENPPKTGDIMLEFTVLATDRVSGGPGVHAHFDLSVGYAGSGRMGGLFKKFGVTLQNTGGGNGLMNHGFYTLRRSALEGVMPVSGQLFIRVERGSALGPHIALRADSITIVGQDQTLGDLPGDYLMGDEMLRQLLDDAIQGGGWWDRDLLSDFLTELLRDTRSLDRNLLMQLLELLLQQDGYDNADRLRDLLDRLLLGGQLRNERLLRELLDELLRDRGTLPDERGGDFLLDQSGDDGNLPDDRLGDDTVIDKGDHGDEGQCFLDRPCIGQAADGFRSSGTPAMGGWFWLNAPTVGQTAEYLFEAPPASSDLVLDIAVQFRNQPTMTPKDTVHLNLTLGYPGSGSLGGQIGPMAIRLQGLWQDPDDDSWRARALVVIPHDLLQSVLPAVGGLYLTFDRIDAYEPDVGLSAGSVLVYPAQPVGR